MVSHKFLKLAQVENKISIKISLLYLFQIGGKIQKLAIGSALPHDGQIFILWFLLLLYYGNGIVAGQTLDKIDVGLIMDQTIIPQANIFFEHAFMDIVKQLNLSENNFKCVLFY